MPNRDFFTSRGEYVNLRYIAMLHTHYLYLAVYINTLILSNFDTNGDPYIISGYTYISTAILIYLRLYLYISGCIYISPVLHNLDTNGAP